MFALRRWIGVLLAVLALGIAGLGWPGPAAAEPNAPLKLTFDKTLSDPAGVWTGTVDGACGAGTLTTTLTALRIDGPIWNVAFEWDVDGADCAFVAHLSGTLNTRTGRVIMNGTVVDGDEWLVGAQVHEEGQLVDPELLQFQGTIQVMPGSADGG